MRSRDSQFLGLGLVAALAAALGLGCVSPEGRFDFDPAADFAAYRSFFVVDAPSEAEEVPLPTQDVAQSQLIDRRVRAEIERVLVAKGLTGASEDDADLLFAFTMGSRQATRTEVYPDGGIRRWPHGWWRDHWDRVYTRIYTEGLLIVDAIDPETNKLVWRGWTTDPLPRSADIGKTAEHAVRSVLAGFPPERK